MRRYYIPTSCMEREIKGKEADGEKKKKKKEKKITFCV